MEKLIKDYGLFIVGAIAIYYFFIRKKDEEETSSYKYRGTTTPGFRIAYTKGKGKCCKCDDGSSCCGDCPACCNKSGGVASHVFPTHSRKKDAPKKSSRYTGFAGNGEPAGLEESNVKPPSIRRLINTKWIKRHKI